MQVLVTFKFNEILRIVTRNLFILLLFAAHLSASGFDVPDLSLTNLNGETQNLSQFRGRPIVLNFWATWCVPCRKEMPLFVELQHLYADRVQFIGASTDSSDQRNEVEAFAKKFKINFPIWIGATPEQQAAFKLATGIPSTIIIDAEGKGCFRIIGEASRENLISRIEFLLSNSSAAAPQEIVLPEGITPEHFREHELGLEDEHEHHDEEESAESEVPS